MAPWPHMRQIALVGAWLGVFAVLRCAVVRLSAARPHGNTPHLQRPLASLEGYLGAVEGLIIAMVPMICVDAILFTPLRPPRSYLVLLHALSLDAWLLPISSCSTP